MKDPFDLSELCHGPDEGHFVVETCIKYLNCVFGDMVSNTELCYQLINTDVLKNYQKVQHKKNTHNISTD